VVEGQLTDMMISFACVFYVMMHSSYSLRIHEENQLQILAKDEVEKLVPTSYVKKMKDLSAVLNTVWPKGCPLTFRNTCAKSFVSDDLKQAVCYEQVLNKPPLTLDVALAMKKNGTSLLYGKSIIFYGMDCASRGYVFDKKRHPCYPHHLYTVFRDEAGQQAYRKYRQVMYDKLFPLNPLNVTKVMLETNCGSKNGESDTLAKVLKQPSEENVRNTMTQNIITSLSVMKGANTLEQAVAVLDGE